MDEAAAIAEKILAAAEEAREKARTRAIRAAREKLKITEHGRLWSLSEAQRLERLTEAELEEFPGRPGMEGEAEAAPDSSGTDMGDGL